MTITENGDVLIHNKTWETIINDAHYAELAEKIENLESHYQSMQNEGRVNFDDYLAKRNV